MGDIRHLGVVFGTSGYEVQLSLPSSSFDGLRPSLFRRYIDDIVMAWEHGQETYEAFKNHLNQDHETSGIKLTFEQEMVEKPLVVLDLEVETRSGAIVTNFYRKPTASDDVMRCCLSGRAKTRVGPATRAVFRFTACRKNGLVTKSSPGVELVGP